MCALRKRRVCVAMGKGQETEHDRQHFEARADVHNLVALKLFSGEPPPGWHHPTTPSEPSATVDSHVHPLFTAAT